MAISRMTSRSGGFRALAAAALGVALVGTMSAPAFAAVAEDGTRYCTGSTPQSGVRWEVSGDGYVRPPGSGTTYYYAHNSSWWTGFRSGVGSGGYWRVTGEFSLDVAYTTATCSLP